MRGQQLRGFALALGSILLVSACTANETTNCAWGPSEGCVGTWIRIDTVLNPDDGYGTFIARGDAVDYSVVCSEGVFQSVDFDLDGDPWWYEDRYVCDDESGSFTVRTEIDAPGVNVEHPGWAEGTWTVVIESGDGAYADLDGSGTYTVLFPSMERAYLGDLSP